MPSSADSLKERVAQALADKIAPALQMDGARLEVLDVADGIARLRVGGACSGCPTTLMAIITGLEQELRRHVPEVEFVEVVP